MIRLKVLSNGVLRGKLIKRLSDHVLQVEMSWPVEQDIFKGFEFRILGESFTSKIERVGLAENRIYLQSTLTKDFDGAVIEISSNEEVPVLAARLLTSTPLMNRFPPLEMKLGSTRGTNAIL